jgi:hypothetical protein
MKRAFVCIAALSALSFAAPVQSSGAATAVGKKVVLAKKIDPCDSKPSKYAREQCEKFDASAPGDEYFGRMKMSYLGINNTFHDEAIRAGSYTTDPTIEGKVAQAEDALNDWMRKYPNDPQLARTYYLGTEMFKRIYTMEAQQKAWKYMQLLAHQFPDTYFGKLVKREIAIGFTEHYFAVPLPCPTPLPPGTLVQELPVPMATLTPSPVPGQPKVLMVDQPCVPVPSPTPIPALTPSPIPVMVTPTPTGTGTPAPEATGTPGPEVTVTPTPAASATP